MRDIQDFNSVGIRIASPDMMAKAHLDRVVESAGSRPLSELLAELDRLVQASLKSEASVAHLENGLDIALCRYRASTGLLEFAGAGLPLYVWTKGALVETLGDRAHLGFSGSRRERFWSDHSIPVSKGARIFLVSDGVLDLPGGEAGLPFGRARLRGLLERIAPLPLAEGGVEAAAALDAYNGSLSQRDDLTFVGLGIDTKGKEE